MANELARGSRRAGAPSLSPDSGTDTVLGWLRWCDGSGDFDGTETWEILEAIVANA